MSLFPNIEQIAAKDTFAFECQRCGACCQNVKKTVMVESLDLFRLAKHLNISTAEASAEYTEMAVIAWGVPILVMKTQGENDACVFFKSGKCGIWEHKPRICATYPLVAGPDDENEKNFIVFKSPERQFHYSEKKHIAGEWVTDKMDGEAYDYVIAEYKLLRELGKILCLLPRELEKDVMEQMLLYRFIMFDTDKDFMKQFMRNMALLKARLQQLLN